MKTEQEIQDVIDKIAGSSAKFPGQTFEEGARSALEWAIDQWEESDGTPADEY